MWHSVGTLMPARRSARQQHFALFGGDRSPVDFDGDHGVLFVASGYLERACLRLSASLLW